MASPVRADSSVAAYSDSTQPSTGSTSPGPTTTTSSAWMASSPTTSMRSSIRRRAVRGTRSSKARRSFVARCSAAASRAWPVASITAISAPARYSPTANVPTNESRGRGVYAYATGTDGGDHQQSAGTGTTVAANQHISAICRAPSTQAPPPTASAEQVTASSAQRVIPTVITAQTAGSVIGGRIGHRVGGRQYPGVRVSERPSSVTLSAPLKPLNRWPSRVRAGSPYT